MLECVLCRKRFRESDVRALLYFPSTRGCRSCYKHGQDAPYSAWCFGKPVIVGPNGRVLEYGYNEKARECREECPDRKICPMFVAEKFGESVAQIESPFSQMQTAGARAWMRDHVA